MEQQFDFMKRLIDQLESRQSKFDRIVKDIRAVSTGRARAIATLLQTDIIDGGTGRGVLMGGLLEEAVDVLEDGLSKLQTEMDEIKQPFIDRVESFLFDHRASLGIIRRIADEGKTEILARSAAAQKMMAEAA